VFAAIRVATRHDLPLLHDLLNAGAQRQLQFGKEDIAVFLERGGVVVGVDAARLAAMLVVDIEARPHTLPPAAPDRLFIRGLVVRHGLSPSTALCDLLPPLQGSAAPQPRILIAHSGASWYNRSLTHAGLVLAERVRFLELDNVAQQVRKLGEATPLVTLQAGGFDELDALALLDAAAFPPIWHFSAAALRPLLLQGTLRTAWHAAELVGYWLMTFNGALAHVARLAVHPRWQGRGIGRQLMQDALHTAAAADCRRMVLNTQIDNRPAQRLYRSLGFRTTGEEFAVYTMLLPIVKYTPGQSPG
jgi:ribosomal protein S18 acetylase RimI-like enzyme